MNGSTCPGRRDVIILDLALFYSTLIFIEIALVFPLPFLPARRRQYPVIRLGYFLFWGQSVFFTKFQLTGTIRATFQLTYISAYWDSPKLCFRGPRARPRGASRARPSSAHSSPPEFVGTVMCILVYFGFQPTSA